MSNHNARIRWGLLMFLAGAWLGPVGAATAAEAGAYAIQAGDVLAVSVWKEPDLQSEVLVRPDGGFSFPLAGNIDAHGKSVDDLQAELVERIGKYIPDPVVTVAVREVAGNQVYVLGKVNRPGSFNVRRPVDVMQALSIAGGTSTFAEVNNIRVLRRTNGSLTAIPFRYSDMEDGTNLNQNIVLQSGDVVVVP